MATLNLKISEEISIGGENRGSTKSIAIDNITTYNQSLIDVPTTAFVNVVNFDAVESVGTYDPSNLKYLRITAVTPDQASETVTIKLVVSPSESHEIKLENGNSFIMFDGQAGDGTSFSNLTSIQAKASSASSQVDLFVASL
jgi:hypothetical protein